MSDALKRSLAERIERLKKLHDLHAPSSILCIEVMLVFKAAFAAHSEEMGRAFSSWVSDVAQGEIAVCPHCGSYMPHEMHICDACIDREDAEAEQPKEEKP